MKQSKAAMFVGVEAQRGAAARQRVANWVRVQSSTGMKL